MDLMQLQNLWESDLKALDFNKDNYIDTLVYGAYSSTISIMQLNSKKAAKKQSEKLQQISKQAKKLSEEMSNLPHNLRVGISFSLMNREQCNIPYPDKDVTEFLEKLSRAALHADEVLLKKIPDGIYNPFLVAIADRLFSPTTSLLFQHEHKPIKQQKQHLIQYWEKHKKQIKKSAATIIAIKYMAGDDYPKKLESATRTIKNNIENIIEARIDWTLKIHAAWQKKGSNSKNDQ